ncbi:MAG: hypothetical protein ABI354_01510 [Candidatus Saccharimonadales bacterium]
MVLDNAEKILVVALSVMLAIFLILSILALVKLIQVLNHLRNISEKAEKIANTAESVGEFFTYTAGPVAVGKFLASITEAVRTHKKKSKGDE